MNEEILLKEYHNLHHDVKKIYVVPLINYSFKKSNYLYLLYKNFILREDSPGRKKDYDINIQSLSVFALPRIVLGRIKNEKCILHYHWLEITSFLSLTGMIWKLSWISFYKLLHGKIIWTIHNEFPHSNNYILLNKIIRRYMAHIADKLQVHCRSAIDIMAPILNIEKSKFFIASHPEFPAELMDRNKAVDLLDGKYFKGLINKEDILFLMFGEIAEYKGIKKVVEIFNNLDERKKLIIAGVIKKGNEKYFKELLLSIKNKEQVLISEKRIPDDDIPLFFNSCAYAIFNFNDVLTSGSVKLALNYDKKIIIPFKGCLKELSGNNVIQFNNIEELNNILISC
jgi:glycosyltransferase involved in cell wall biosynthesis